MTKRENQECCHFMQTVELFVQLTIVCEKNNTDQDFHYNKITSFLVYLFVYPHPIPHSFPIKTDLKKSNLYPVPHP